MSSSRCAVVFDWNGTLLADTALCLRSTNKVLEAFAQKPTTLRDYQRFYDIPFVQMYIELGCSEKEIEARKEEFLGAFLNHYQKHEMKLRLRKGARQALEAIKASGFKTAILSNYMESYIKEHVIRLRLRGHIDTILANKGTDSHPLYKRNKGERLRSFIEAHTIQKALVVGDTKEEIEIAQSYGYYSAAVTGGSCSFARLRQTRPDFIIDHLEELPEITRKLFERVVR